MCSTVGGVQYHGGYLEYCGVFSTMGDILSTVGVFSTVGCSVPRGDIMMHVGGYHDARGGIS